MAFQRRQLRLILEARFNVDIRILSLDCIIVSVKQMAHRYGLSLTFNNN